MEIARLVAPEGSVTGIDMDEDKLALARQAAAERELGNVEFRALDASHWDEPDSCTPSTRVSCCSTSTSQSTCSAACGQPSGTAGS